jgi:hypothetical protein
MQRACLLLLPQGVLLGLVTLLKDSCKLVRMEAVRALLKLTKQHAANLALLKAVEGIEPAIEAVYTSERDENGKKVDYRKAVQLANRLLKRLQGKEEEGKRLAALRLQRRQEVREEQDAHMAMLLQLLQQQQRQAAELAAARAAQARGGFGVWLIRASSSDHPISRRSACTIIVLAAVVDAAGAVPCHAGSTVSRLPFATWHSHWCYVERLVRYSILPILPVPLGSQVAYLRNHYAVREVRSHARIDGEVGS